MNRFKVFFELDSYFSFLHASCSTSFCEMTIFLSSYSSPPAVEVGEAIFAALFSRWCVWAKETYWRSFDECSHCTGFKWCSASACRVSCSSSSTSQKRYILHVRAFLKLDLDTCWRGHSDWKAGHQMQKQKMFVDAVTALTSFGVIHSPAHVLMSRWIFLLFVFVTDRRSARRNVFAIVKTAWKVQLLWTNCDRK